MFPNASIIIDMFHIVQLLTISLNKTRIRVMKKKMIIENIKDTGDYSLNQDQNLIVVVGKNIYVLKI